MVSLEKPKRRLVVYVTEETFDHLDSLAKKETRSISSIAERYLCAGLGINPVNGEVPDSLTAQAGTARMEVGEEILKKSVIDVISNLPDENLQNLVSRLASMLERHGPAQHGTAQDDSAHDLPKMTVKGVKDPIEVRPKPDMRQVQDLAKRLIKFLKDNDLTQRSFKQIYGLDITQISRWERGTKNMSEDTRIRFEKIISKPNI